MNFYEDPLSLIKLRERIALAEDFSPDERTLILDLLSLNTHSDKHEYPRTNGPGSSPWASAAWELLDLFPPRAMTVADRFKLGGMIAGALERMFETGKRAVSGRIAGSTEIHTPKNPGGQIDALYAAISVDPDGAEGICAGPIGDYGVAPLIVAERRHLGFITDVARSIVQLTGKRAVLCRFTLREDLEEIKP